MELKKSISVEVMAEIRNHMGHYISFDTSPETEYFFGILFQLLHKELLQRLFC